MTTGVMLVQRLLPPSKRWAWIEGSAILATLLAIAIRALLPASTAAAAGPLPPARTLEAAPALKEHLFARFASAPATGAELAAILSRTTARLEELQLVLESRNVESSPADAMPPRQRHRIVVSGAPAAHVQFIHYLAVTPAPLRIQEIHWTAGRGPGQRLLEVVLDIFVE
ncbi:MAG: hypothetical protein L0Z55_12900 [Planctomycetes bacterium]|nr:hypothetical protein [Planctomycetota bacterium]